MKKLALISLFIFIVIGIFSQNIDSLLKVSKVGNTEKKIKAYLQLSHHYLNDSSELAYKYAILASQQNIKDNKLKGDSFIALGNAYNDTKKHDSALIAFQKANSFYLKENYQAGQFKAQFILSKTYRQIDSIRIALEIAKKAHELAVQSDNIEILRNSFDHLSNLFFLTSEYNATIECLFEVHKIDSSLNDSMNLSDTYNNITDIYRRLGNYSKAIEYGNKSLIISQQLKDSAKISGAYQSLASIYYYTDDYQKAATYFIKASTIFENLGDEHKAAGLNNNIGSVYNEIKDYAKAKLYFEKAYIYYKKIDFVYAIAIVSGNLSLANEGLGKIDEALELAKESKKLYQHVGNEEGIINAMTNLAGIYLKQSNFTKADAEYSKALDLALKGKYIHPLRNIYKKLVELKELQGQHKLALDYFRKYQTVKDSLINEESRTQLNDMQAKLDLHEHKSKIELLEKENQIQLEKSKRQRLVSISIIIVAILLLFLVIVIYRALTYSKKAKNILQNQNNEIKEQRNIIAGKNKQLTDSIKYAKRVQDALFTPIDSLKNHVSEYFLISNPQNIVSGDFHWHKYLNDKLYLAVADCTGHGVPGAFMSTLGNTLLNDLINENCKLQANEILNQLRNRVKQSLHQENMYGNTDGMDISFCIIDNSKKEIEFAGAYNPLYHLSGDTLNEIKGDKMPIAISRKENSFNLHHIKYNSGDQFYLSSDGFYDQFGGNEHSKITRKTFKQLIMENAAKPMQEQAEIMLSYFEEWKSDQEQTDDMMVLGFKL